MDYKLIGKVITTTLNLILHEDQTRDSRKDHILQNTRRILDTIDYSQMNFHMLFP